MIDFRLKEIPAEMKYEQCPVACEAPWCKAISGIFTISQSAVSFQLSLNLAEKYLHERVPIQIRRDAPLCRSQ